MCLPNSMRILYNISFLTESQTSLKPMNSWCTASLYSHFFLQYLMNAKDLISSWSVTWKPTLMIPNNFVYIRTYSSEKDIGKVFVWSWQQWYPTIITTVSFIALLVNWYSNRLLPLIWQFFFISNKINHFMDLKTVIFHLLLESVLPGYVQYLTIFNCTILQ
jgi:hypothetical protein